jgi:hypothetical protein
MEAVHEGGQESSGQLVFALCARFEAGKAFAQAILDALVVAGFEMKAGDVLASPPVASVQGVATAHAQSARYGFVAALTDHQYQGARHGPGQVAKERQGERRVVPVFGEGLAVEGMHCRKVAFAGLIAMDDAEVDAGTRDLRALLANVLAMPMIEGGEESRKVRPA